MTLRPLKNRCSYCQKDEFRSFLIAFPAFDFGTRFGISLHEFEHYYQHIKFGRNLGLDPW